MHRLYHQDLKLLIATHNDGKKREVKKLLKDLPIEVLTLDDIKQKIDPPDENGATYEENALIKAKTIGDITKMVTISDDSGLEISSLPGMLGVKSARFFPGSGHDRNMKLLTLLHGKNDRNATFVCCIVLYDPKTQEHKAFVGKSDGSISEKELGNDGFDYDFVFIPKGYKQTYAQIGNEKKNTMSHRFKALMLLKEYVHSHTV